MESQLDARAFPLIGKIEGEYNLASHDFSVFYFPSIELE
jgi:hypothetical protein